MTTAIIQCFDTGPLESLVLMLRSVGWRAALPNAKLCDEVKKLGCDTVYSVDQLVKDYGYERPEPLPEVGVSDMSRRDIVWIDVKGHRNGPKLWKRWPHLENRTLWYRINGGKPEHVIRADGMDCGDEVNPPCPVLTPNRWYAVPVRQLGNPAGTVYEPTPWADKSYTFWPPFARWQEHQVPRIDAREKQMYDPPLCLIHNVEGWGYGALLNEMSKLGVQVYGRGSPDGLLPHREAVVRLSSALAMVHLKSSDAPGYALYEAMASACPVVCTRRLIWRCRMQDLLVPGETCLVFDRETHDALSPSDVAECSREVAGHLRSLHDREFNRRIGEAGRRRLSEIVWKPDCDAASLDKFLAKHFGS